MLKNNFKRGDTIVETMFAFAVFGLVAISSLQIMQRGIRLTQTALEMNLVRSQMSSQAEALRFLNSSHISDVAYGRPPTSGSGLIWKKITDESGAVAGFSSLVKDGQCQAPNKINPRAFALGVRNSAGIDQIDGLKLDNADSTGYARLVYGNSSSDSNEVHESTSALGSSAGLWVEAAKSTNLTDSQSQYYDFHIRSCWLAPASPVPVTLSTLVRLYAPK